MKKTLTILTLALAIGCVPAEDKPQTCDEQCQQQNNEQNNVTPENGPDIKGSFIAGHLGNYLDCPAEGYSESSSEPARDSAGADFAPCEQGDDSCGGPLNCDGAQLTIRLTNGGLGDATSVVVSEIEIFDVDGVLLASLPIIDVLDASTNEAFDGTLDVGESIDLRVDYRGPVNLYELLPTDETGSRVAGSDTALIEVTVTADDHDDVVIDGGEVFVLPSVVT